MLSQIRLRIDKNKGSQNIIVIRIYTIFSININYSKIIHNKFMKSSNLSYKLSDSFDASIDKVKATSFQKAPRFGKTDINAAWNIGS